VTRFNFAPMISLELVTLDTSNFVCWFMHGSTGAHIIYYPQKGCVQSHVTSLSFGKLVIISR